MCKQISRATSSCSEVLAFQGESSSFVILVTKLNETITIAITAENYI